MYIAWKTKLQWRYYFYNVRKMQCIYYIEKCSLIYCVLGERKVEAVLNGVCELHLGGIDNPQRGQNSEVGDCFILHYFMDLYGVAHHLTSPIVAGNIP